MRIYLTQEKTQKLKSTCDKIITFKPHDSQLSSCHVWPFTLKTDWYGQNNCFTACLVHFDTCMQLTDPSIADMKWWRDSVHSAYNVVQHNQPEITIFTDASSHRFGAILGRTASKGAWSPSKALHHISYLEMLAVLFALEAFQVHLEGKHVRVIIDNTTACQHLPMWVQVTRYCGII